MVQTRRIKLPEALPFLPANLYIYNGLSLIT